VNAQMNGLNGTVIQKTLKEYDVVDKWRMYRKLL
jgi:hypothetical protein